MAGGPYAPPAASVADLLGQWARGRGPLYERLAAALREATTRGRLPAGMRLPAEREFAAALAVSRGTVTAAYDTLRAEGVVEGRRGSGTFVLPAATSSSHPPLTTTETTGSNALYRSVLTDSSRMLDLSVASPPGIPEVAEAMRDAAGDIEALLGQPGYFTLGLDALRDAVAARFRAEGVPTTREQVLITTGVQQALSLLAALYVRPGDLVAVENPTYHGAFNALRAAGARIEAVPIDDRGMDVEALASLLARGNVRLVHVTPTYSNPTGTVLDRTRRARLAQLAREHRVPVMADTTTAPLRFGSEPPPHVAAYDPQGHVITVGTASKTFWAGLRTGWVRAHEHVVARLAELKASADLGSSVVSQAVTARLLPRAAELYPRRSAELRANRDLLAAALRQRLPDWSFVLPEGGICLWVELPQGNAAAFTQFAMRYGVVATPGPVFSVDGGCRGHLRLPFTMPPEVLREGLGRLAAAWEAFEPAAGRSALAGSAVV